MRPSFLAPDRGKAQPTKKCTIKWRRRTSVPDAWLSSLRTSRQPTRALCNKHWRMVCKQRGKWVLHAPLVKRFLTGLPGIAKYKLARYCLRTSCPDGDWPIELTRPVACFKILTGIPVAPRSFVLELGAQGNFAATYRSLWFPGVMTFKTRLTSIVVIAVLVVWCRFIHAESGEPLLSPELPSTHGCPASCESIFNHLHDAENGRGKVRRVHIQVRGGSKSGAGMMAEWAWGALARTCLYLQTLYGKASCKIMWRTQPPRGKGGIPHKIFFEPGMAADADTAPCSCDTVAG